MRQRDKHARGLSLGTVAGIRIVVHPSSPIAMVILAIILTAGPNFTLTRQSVTNGAVLAALLLASIFIHETAHALTARAFGVQVREIVMTLSGGHTSFASHHYTPLVSGATAAAGPAANVMIAVVAQGLLMTGWVGEPLTEIVQWVVLGNVLLAVFNALPGLPLDGGRVAEALVWAVTKREHRATMVAAWGGRVVSVSLAVAVVAYPVSQGTRPGLFAVACAVMLVGLMWPAASHALTMAKRLERREGVTAGALMVSAVSVAHDVTVADARAAAAAANATEVVVLSADAQPAGHFPVTLTSVVPEHLWSTSPLASVTMPLPRGASVEPELAGDDLIDQLKHWWGTTDVWVVHDRATVVGVVKLADVLKALE